MKVRNKVNKQLLNLIRDNIGLISDPRKYFASGGKFCSLRSHIFSGFTIKI